MENKETKSEEMLLIKDFQDTQGKTGTFYTKVSTDKGNYSVFEADIIKVLKENKGKQVQVEVATNDRGFKNIRKFLSVVECVKMPSIVGSNIVDSSPASNNFADARALKDQSIYTSYAKDIFVSFLENGLDVPNTKEGLDMLMDGCISLIKRAKESFA
jgi:hypothetical protein